eukprot:CAMPEP_0170620428 /NCGR_PEP_ID=MMETSP0224-20130122/28052_1 /TAXON_ID=285029 /ORGANISM="Togula jolla, Strain CCCM 725" /LENGTH=163 /DNA_ID=CAMNT_0010946599 /DNA_START=50 /DNA_END=541 /DNA_ORIENTATION=-
MAFKVEIPDGYGLLFVPLAASYFLNFFLSFQVMAARSKYNVQYPNLYAPVGHKDAEAFNCVQRAHQNTLETWGIIMISMFAAGLVFPVQAAVAGMVWVFGRIIYGVGYALGSPSYRTPGSLISHLGDFPLFGMVCYLAYGAVKDPQMISMVKVFAKAHTGVEL